MDSVLAQILCRYLDLIFAIGRKLGEEPLIEVLAAMGNMNVK